MLTATPKRKKGAKLLQRPDLLANALTKITKTLKNFQSEGRFIRLTSNLLVTSEIIHRPQILSAHPKIDSRLRNIDQLNSKTPKSIKPKKLAAAIALASIILIVGALASVALANVQASYTTSKMTLTIPGAAQETSFSPGLSNYAVINSNFAWRTPPDQIITLPSPATHGLPASNLNPNQPALAIHSSGGEYSKIILIYALTNTNSTTLTIKF